MKNKTKTILIFTLAFLFILILCLIIIIPNYKHSQEQKKLYNDYVAVSNVVGISYNKNLDFYYDQIIANEKYYSKKSGLEKEDIIFNYAQYDYVPVLSYLKEPSSNSELLSAFKSYSQFINTSITHKCSYVYDCVVDANDEDSLYSKMIDHKTVEVVFGKYMITKNSLQSTFQNFLKKRELTVDYFYHELLINETFYERVKNDLIREEELMPYEINDEKLVDFIKLYDDRYYETYKDNYIVSITNILRDFTGYLNSLDPNDFEYEYLETTFIVRRNVKLKNMPSKYYTYNWSVDMNFVVDESEKSSLPIFYY